MGQGLAPDAQPTRDKTNVTSRRLARLLVRTWGPCVLVGQGIRPSLVSRMCSGAFTGACLDMSIGSMSRLGRSVMFSAISGIWGRMVVRRLLLRLVESFLRPVLHYIYRSSIQHSPSSSVNFLLLTTCSNGHLAGGDSGGEAGDAGGRLQWHSVVNITKWLAHPLRPAIVNSIA